MNCQNCGKKVSKNNRFCTTCGQPILIELDLPSRPLLYQQALDFYHAQKLGQAKAELFELVLKHPYNSQYQSLLGCIYLKQNKENLAGLHFEKALEIDANSWHANYNLGIIYAKQEKYARAKEMFRAALNLNQKHLSSLYNLGTIFLKEGKYREAINELVKAYRINPDHENNRINLNLAFKKLKISGEIS